MIGGIGMEKANTCSISPSADRMGRFIGQIRSHEGVTLKQLARGLCAPSMLARIENGEREVGKQLTDALFQRLGKPAELFERILDWGEFRQWTHRQEIIAHLRRGDADAAECAVRSYPGHKKSVLDRQFAAIVEINCRFLRGAPAEELMVPVRDALRLTQPGFPTAGVGKMLLSQNEGRLLFAYLQLRERIEGFSAVAKDYAALLRYFRQKRYESRERVYLFPYVACRVIENEYREGNFEAALAICEDVLDELTREKRLFAYDQLLEWKQKFFDAMGNSDQTPGKLLEQLRLILADVPEQTELLIPCDERGHVYCLNQVICDRRRLLGITQEALAEGICEPRTISRIENRGGNLHRKNRKRLLQRVNMSGERYDYEVITDRYEDYLLRSELDRAVVNRDAEKAIFLLAELTGRIPNIPTNLQYLKKVKCLINERLSRTDPRRMSDCEVMNQLEEALRHTLPLDLQKISEWPVSILSVNEILLLVLYATQIARCADHKRALEILTYAKKCLENTGTDVAFYDDMYTRIEAKIAGVLVNSGHYQQSVESFCNCLKVSLDNHVSKRLAKYMYGVACNVESKGLDCFSAEQRHYGKNSISLLRQAYAAAQISGDLVGQQHIRNYCLKSYKVDLML